MPDSFVSIANSALTKLGSSFINSFDDGDTKANFAKERYLNAVYVVLRLHPWNCATRRVLTANRTDIAPAFEYTYYHALPSDWLRTLSIGPEGTDYRIEGKNIATDATSLEHKYIKKITDPTEIDEACAEAIAFYLAWDLATPLQQNAEIKNEMWEGFMKLLKLAKSVDAQEEPPNEIQADLWIESRVGYPAVNRAHNNG